MDKHAQIHVIWYEAYQERYFIDNEPFETAELVQLRHDALRRRDGHATVGGVALTPDYIQQVLTCVFDHGWFFGVVKGNPGVGIDVQNDQDFDTDDDGKIQSKLSQALISLKLASDIRCSTGKVSEELETGAHSQIEGALNLLAPGAGAAAHKEIAVSLLAERQRPVDRRTAN